MLKIARVLLTSIFLLVLILSFSNQALAANETGITCGIHFYTSDSDGLDVHLVIDRKEVVSFEEAKNFIRSDNNDVYSTGNHQFGKFQTGEDAYLIIRIMPSLSCSGGNLTLKREISFDSSGKGFASVKLLGIPMQLPATGYGQEPYRSESDQRWIFIGGALTLLFFVALIAKILLSMRKGK